MTTKWLDACSVGFYWLFPHPLIQGAAGGGGVGRGPALEFGSYRSGALYFGGGGEQEL